MMHGIRKAGLYKESGKSKLSYFTLLSLQKLRWPVYGQPHRMVLLAYVFFLLYTLLLINTLSSERHSSTPKRIYIPNYQTRRLAVDYSRYATEIYYQDSRISYTFVEAK
jgi:membrane-anchored glycerophosphoryl diester phosphodiesterase (GDPDase)